jgi:uncharacterized protein YkwD
MLLSLTGLVIACGSSNDAGAPREEGPSTKVEPRDRPEAGVTDGGLGDATADSDSKPPRDLSDGGPLDITPATPDRDREGVGAGAACADVDIEPGAGNLDAVVAATTCLLNGERQDRGLVPLSPSRPLQRAAAVHASDMVANSYFSHTGRDRSEPADRIRAAGYLPAGAAWTVGENLAWGGGGLSTPKSIMTAWMNSPGHRENILTPEFRELGLSVVLGSPTGGDGSSATYANTFGVVTAIPRRSRGRSKPRSRAAGAPSRNRR